MAATLTLTLDNDHPAHGDTVTATYTVFGNDGVPERSVTIVGSGTVGGEPIGPANAVLVLPGTDPLPEAFNAPTVDGLTFEATSDPKAWTALVP